MLFVSTIGLYCSIPYSPYAVLCKILFPYTVLSYSSTCITLCHKYSELLYIISESSIHINAISYESELGLLILWHVRP
jgi:hypothetical protein